MSLFPHILGFWAKDTEKICFTATMEKERSTNKPKNKTIISDYTNRILCGVLLIPWYDILSKRKHKITKDHLRYLRTRITTQEGVLEKETESDSLRNSNSARGRSTTPGQETSYLFFVQLGNYNRKEIPHSLPPFLILSL